jgi:hypothetical protein
MILFSYYVGGRFDPWKGTDASETFLFVVAHIFILNRENFIHHGSTIFVAVHSNQI